MENSLIYNSMSCINVKKYRDNDKIWVSSVYLHNLQKRQYDSTSMYSTSSTSAVSKVIKIDKIPSYKDK